MSVQDYSWLRGSGSWTPTQEYEYPSYEYPSDESDSESDIVLYEYIVSDEADALENDKTDVIDGGDAGVYEKGYQQRALMMSEVSSSAMNSLSGSRDSIESDDPHVSYGKFFQLDEEIAEIFREADLKSQNDSKRLAREKAIKQKNDEEAKFLISSNDTWERMTSKIKKVREVKPLYVPKAERSKQKITATHQRSVGTDGRRTKAILKTKKRARQVLLDNERIKAGPSKEWKKKTKHQKPVLYV